MAVGIGYFRYVRQDALGVTILVIAALLGLGLVAIGAADWRRQKNGEGFQGLPIRFATCGRLLHQSGYEPDPLRRYHQSPPSARKSSKMFAS